MSYDRKIKYLELMEDGISLQNAGFIKLEIRDAQVSLMIKADKLNPTVHGSMQVFLVGKEKEVILGDLYLEQGKGSRLFDALDNQNLAKGMSYEELQEIHIRLQNSRYLRCIIKEKQEPHFNVQKEPAEVAIPLQNEEVPVKEEEIQTKEELKEEVAVKPMQQPELNGILLEAAPVDERNNVPLALQMPHEEHREAEPEMERKNPASTLASTKWQQLWDSYPHIMPFEDQREYLKLKPEDLVVLSGQCYPLVCNSFLLHGFYNYQHLILTKELVRGQEQYYIGAPGNFYTKEKQVAVLFGFESFEGKVEPAQNGDFGYYMIPVEI